MARKRPNNRTGSNRPGTRLDAAERISAAKMADAGESLAQIARTLGRSAESVKRAIADARSVLDGNASEYARLHLQAAKTAARKGRSGPMEWAMERLGVVEPPKTAGDSGPRFSVRIGVVLPGLPAQSATIQGNPGPKLLVEGELETDE